MLSDAAIQAIADQVQAGFTAASSTCKVFSYWPNPTDQVWLASPGVIVPWLVLTAGDEYDEVLADGLRGTVSPRLDRLFGRYHLLGQMDQPGTTAQQLQQRSRADKNILVGLFAQGVGASIGGAVIEAARTIQVKNPLGGPYDPTNKSRAQLTWDVYITIRPHVHT